MKSKLLLFILILTNLSINAQKTEVLCIGENWAISYNNGTTKSKQNSQVASIFLIDEQNNLIKLKTSTRNGVYNDSFTITNTRQTKTGITYQCYKENDNTEYVISIKEMYVEMIFGNSNSTTVIQSPIHSRKKLKSESEKKDNDYIYYEDWKEINVEVVLKRAKLNSLITGTYEKNEDNILRIVELADNKIFFKLSLFNGRNLGNLEGLIDINEKTIFEKNDFGLCKFEIKIMDDRIEIITVEDGDYCGYGNGIRSDGIYYLKSRKIPNMKNE